MQSIEIDIDFDRVMMPVGPLLTLWYRCSTLCLLLWILVWLVALVIASCVWGARMQHALAEFNAGQARLLEAVREGHGGVRKAGADAGGT